MISVSLHWLSKRIIRLWCDDYQAWHLHIKLCLKLLTWGSRKHTSSVWWCLKIVELQVTTYTFHPNLYLIFRCPKCWFTLYSKIHPGNFTIMPSIWVHKTLLSIKVEKGRQHGWYWKYMATYKLCHKCELSCQKDKKLR